MSFVKYFLILMISLLFLGCAPKNEVIQSSSVLITLKTKKFSFQDTGFLKKGNDFLYLEIFSMGNPLAKLSILKGSDRVCLNEYCFNKRVFNEKYLSSNYPDSLLENVLNAKPVFNGKNLIKTDNGFYQNIREKNKFNIKYKVKNGNISFKDRLNHIIISIKSLKM